MDAGGGACRTARSPRSSRQAAPPSPSTHPDSVPEGNPRPLSGKKHGKAASGCPIEPANTENHPQTARKRPSPDKKPPKEPRRTVVRRHFRPETISVRAILTPPSAVYGYLFYSADGGVFSDSSTPSSASTVVCGGRKRKGHRRNHLFSHHHKPPRWGNRLGISNGKQAWICPIKMEAWD